MNTNQKIFLGKMLSTIHQSRERAQKNYKLRALKIHLFDFHVACSISRREGRKNVNESCFNVTCKVKYKDIHTRDIHTQKKPLK